MLLSIELSAEKVAASLDVPGFARASMDGFAVQAEVTIGSMMPPGADAVVLIK